MQTLSERKKVGVNASEVSLAIDVRGAMIKLGIVSRQGEVLFAQRYPTITTSPADFLDALMQDIDDFQQAQAGRWSYNHVGIGIGGWVDREEGMWLWTRKIRHFKDSVPLGWLIAQKTGKRVVVDNDIHVSTLAENMFGIGRSFSSFLYYHLGSGIAVGVVNEGRLMSGTANYAGECGGSLYDLDGQGNYCTLEEFASGNGMVALTRSLFHQYPDSVLVEADHKNQLFSSTIFQGEEAGDPLSVYVSRQVLRGIGMSVVNLLGITNSEALVFGGGVISDGRLLPKLVEFINEYCAEPTRKTLSYVGTSRLHPEEVGLIGAASLTWDMNGQAKTAEG